MIKIALDYQVERLKRAIDYFNESNYTPFNDHYKEEIKSALRTIEELIL
jgi:hypothetical protein